MTLTQMNGIELRIHKYAQGNGTLPASLSDLPEIPRYDKNAKDGWGKEIIYRVDPNGHVTLESFGRDGKPGGKGEDSDISKTFKIKL